MSNAPPAASTGRASAALAALLRELAASLAPGEYLPSVRQLAAEHGLATNTVQRALRRLAAQRLIVAEPRQGYRVLPASAARSASAPVACIVNTEEGDGSWGRTLAAVFERAGARRGLSLLAVPFRSGGADELERQLGAAGARGVLLNTPDPEVLDVVARSGAPAVMFDSWLPGSGLDAVLQDGFAGAMQAAQYLAGRGHEHLAWLGYRAAGAGPQILERFAGAVAGLAGAGLRLAPELCVEIPADDAELARRKARELLSRSPRPAAVMALWHPVIKGLLAAAGELGLRPGRDFEMVGWSPQESYATGYAALFADCPLPATVVWRISELVEAALKRLEERIANPEMTPLQIKVPTELRLPKRGG